MPEKRTVAFLDILGFGNKIKTTPLDELSALYEQRIAEARATLRPFVVDCDHPTLFPNRPNGAWCNQHVFSDSIILIANTDTDDSCLELFIYVWRLLQAFIAAGFPLRGGISYGEMYSNPGSGIFLGKALTSAYELEGTQDWIGVAIDDSVKERYRDLFNRIENPDVIFSVIFKRYPVPLKKNGNKEMHTINWRYNYVVEKGTRSLFPPSDDLSIQRKIDNALAYAKSTIDRGLIYHKDESKNPIELRTFFVGSREPPFPHGDEL